MDGRPVLQLVDRVKVGAVVHDFESGNHLSVGCWGVDESVVAIAGVVGALVGNVAAKMQTYFFALVWAVKNEILPSCAVGG